MVSFKEIQKVNTERNIINEAFKEITHPYDGPITSFVIVSRGTELCKKYDSELVAKAIHEALDHFGFLSETAS